MRANDHRYISPYDSDELPHDISCIERSEQVCTNKHIAKWLRAPGGPSKKASSSKRDIRMLISASRACFASATPSSNIGESLEPHLIGLSIKTSISTACGGFPKRCGNNSYIRTAFRLRADVFLTAVAEIAFELS